MRRTAVLALTITLGLVGCAKHNPIAPDRASSASGLHTFVLESATDPRLPLPARETGGVSAADWVRWSSVSLERNPAIAADPALFWNQLTTELGLNARLSPPLFARAYALTHVAIFDALVAARDERRGNLPDHSAAAGAAGVVLTYLFPSAADRINAAALAQAGLHQEVGNGVRLRAWLLGRAVGALAVEHGRHDGSSDVFTGPIPTGDCVWTGVNPVLPLCGSWTCWIVDSGDEFQPEAPYACGSESDLRELEQVYQVSLHRTAEQIAIVHKWADLPPPMIWNRLLISRVESSDMSALASARAFAYLNVTMYDAFVSCWRTKYTYWTARPFMRLAGRDPAFTTVITTPNFPSYTSGHSTISAAAAVVMGELFPDERTYFEGQAQEAAISRLWGGIHYQLDNNQGLAVGRRIGIKAAIRMQSDQGLPLAANP